MNVLVIAEHDDETLRPATLNAVMAASHLGDVTVLVAGHGCGPAAEAATRVNGVGRVLVCDAPACAERFPEVLAPLVAGLAKDFTHVLAAATASGKDLLPRIAALLDVQPISDVIRFDGPDTFERPIYAGNAIATVRSADPVKVLTVRATAFPPAAVEGGAASVETVAAPAADARVTLLGRDLTPGGRPELTAARVVVAGGCGLGGRENFHLIEDLADRLGGAIGASRAAVDSGYVPNDCQVGQTGKVVAPELYVAVGISGAIQHLAGMKDSKVIVAINKDADAPIFQVADFGLVEDLFTALPEIIRNLPEKN
jgi:electron transfer flavoprotein alpha subunit